MKIAIIGVGYVGLPSGVGFAELGHEVVCVDKIEAKIQALNEGKLTLYENGLEELFQKNIKTGRLLFTTDTKMAVQDADVVLLAVGTPQDPKTNEADLRYIYQAAKELAPFVTKYCVIANKSTVPVGTAEAVESIIKEHNPMADFDVVSLPEFLREGFAISDFFNPDRIVVGTEAPRAREVLEQLYAPFKDKTEMLFVKRRSSEVIKYASNSFLAMKIHYINEMANFCENAGADINEVAKGIGLDSRIGKKFLNAGPGFGGGCFPKDTNAMAKMAEKFGARLSLIETTIAKNYQRKADMAQRVLNALSSPKGKIAILGLAFKGGTDDVRESPSMEILYQLLPVAAEISVYDPKALENAKQELGEKVSYAQDIYEACQDAEVVAILTEWEIFRNIDLERLKSVMKTPNIVDLRNMLNAQAAKAAGFSYSCIGLK